MSSKVKVIIGSVRPGRLGKPIADWVMRQAGSYNGKLEFELVDLKDVNLPFLDEPIPPKMSDDYVHEHTRRWSRMMKEADALIIVTPEYNHGCSPVLKNAIDFLYNEWLGMPVAIVGYGREGATQSTRQLVEIMEFIGMKTLDYQVKINQVWDAIDDNGNVTPENIRGNIQELFLQLENAQHQ